MECVCVSETLSRTFYDVNAIFALLGEHRTKIILFTGSSLNRLRANAV